MLNFFSNFRREDDGAITVDWVVLTAAIVGLTIGLIAAIASGALDKSTGLGQRIDSMDIATF